MKAIFLEDSRPANDHRPSAGAQRHAGFPGLQIYLNAHIGRQRAGLQPRYHDSIQQPVFPEIAQHHTDCDLGTWGRLGLRLLSGHRIQYSVLNAQRSTTTASATLLMGDDRRSPPTSIDHARLLMGHFYSRRPCYRGLFARVRQTDAYIGVPLLEYPTEHVRDQPMTQRRCDLQRLRVAPEEPHTSASLTRTA
ncbi:hypothetical protein FA15DRAFT_297117 [Coprinopsis marcescibilis]|uniref:Uncharacterized protein n=1 Tax=Coprinopsis marcescibilis TaxID=230819 RepID=A0A5C3KD90_COPMA|nr:hypothetical protein FA15DRAFT_297117 [Coprinopsis marcescibilis]